MKEFEGICGKCEDVLLCRLWDLKRFQDLRTLFSKLSLLGSETWKSKAPSEAKCESSYIAISLNIGPRDFKNPELSPLYGPGT